MKIIFIFKLVLALSAPSIVVCASSTADVPCRAHAWVRAPNLGPGKVVQGDVKVKLNGSCDDVSSYVLGLRFAERSWVKTRREGVTLPVNPYGDGGYPPQIFMSRHAMEHMGMDMGFPDESAAWDRYKSDMKNTTLWLEREDERVAFETIYTLSDGSDVSQKPGREIISSFALLVPSTNYPPAFEQIATGSSDDNNGADSEHIYQYFVDVTFSNGTRKQIEAGYTSFDAATATSLGSDWESINVTTTNVARKQSCEALANCQIENISSEKFTLEVTFPHGRHLEQESINNITIVSHQIGPGLQRPLRIHDISMNVRQNRTWAAKHAADVESAEALLRVGFMYEFELQPKIDDKDLPFMLGYYGKTILPRFSMDGVVKNGTIFSTKPVTAQFQVPRQLYAPFDMYYQSSEVNLDVKMLVRNVSGQEEQPDTTDDFDWTPELREERSEDLQLLSASIPISIYRKPEDGMKVHRLVHYLSPEARAPLFVDPSSVELLLQMTVEDRDALAPLAKAKFVHQMNGENVLKYRYYMADGEMGLRPGPYYVGDTWIRKVPARGKHRDAAQQDGTDGP